MAERAIAIVATGLAVASVTASLSACGAPSQPASFADHGRYQGIGAYAPGLLWPRVVSKDAARSPTAATPADDEHVIAVVDSRTGEIRECGDYSGACISLNPWSRPAADPRIAPVELTEHLSQALQAQKTGGAHDPDR